MDSCCQSSVTVIDAFISTHGTFCTGQVAAPLSLAWGHVARADSNQVASFQSLHERTHFFSSPSVLSLSGPWPPSGSLIDYNGGVCETRKSQGTETRQTWGKRICHHHRNNLARTFASCYLKLFGFVFLSCITVNFL